MSTLNFSDLNLHDSQIIRMEIVFESEEGKSIRLLLRYVVDYETHEILKKWLIFDKCREIELTIHLGYANGHTIIESDEIAKSDLLSKAYEIGKSIGIKPGSLNHYYFDTNSGSRFNFIAETIKLEDGE
jgi:hypothetical protein